MKTLNLKEPFVQQKEFYKAKTRFVAYGGARGGGKSHAVRTKATLLAIHYAGIKILIIRQTYGQLLENHIRVMREDLNGFAVYKDSDKSLSFPNGSLIKFGYTLGDTDVAQYQGQEYDVVFIDEATQFTEHQFDVIRASVRGVNDFPKRMYLTCNPGGIGHSWVKRLFVDRNYKQGEDPKDYTFVRSNVYDNKPLMNQDPDYVKNLESLTGDLRKAWLDGDWNLFAGQFFPEFSPDIHVCKPFPIPDWWKKYRAFDYGFDRLATLWFAINDNGEVFAYREFCKSDLMISTCAKDIISLSFDGEKPEDIKGTYAPPDMWGRTQDRGKLKSELFYENGLDLTKAPNNRVHGWAALREYLKPVNNGEETKAKLHIFSTCEELIRCLPQLVSDSKIPGDCLTEPHEITHVCDALRYFIASRVLPSKEPDRRTDLQKHKDKVLRDMRRKARRRRV